MYESINQQRPDGDKSCIPLLQAQSSSNEIRRGRMYHLFKWGEWGMTGGLIRI